MRLLTEFARPGRAGDIAPLVEALTAVGGAASTPSGGVDLDVLEALVSDHARGMAAAEMAAALDISPITSRHRVDAAIEMHDGLPETHQALTEGRIDRGRAAMIAERTRSLDVELRADVEKVILPLVKGRTAGRLRPLVDRAVIIADPDAANKRAEKARRDREVTHQPLADQMSLLRAVLPADGAVTVFTLIDLLAAATKSPDDDRCVAERRADALTDIAAELLTNGHVDLRDLLAAGGGDEDEDEDEDEQPIADTSATGDARATADARVPSPDAGSASEPGVRQESPVGVSHPDADLVDGQSMAKREHRTPATDCWDCNATDLAGPTDARQPATPGSDEVQDTTCPSKPNGGSSRSTARPTPSRMAPAQSLSPEQSTTSQAGSDQVLRRQGRRPHLTLTMSLSTFYKLDQFPANLDGYGAITAEMALVIASCARSLSLVLIDPKTGSPLHVSARRSYRPRQSLRDSVTTLFETCRFPSCRQPAWRCDLDHRAAFDHEDPERGGATTDDNLDPLCRRHHRMKHHSDWAAVRAPDGSMTWISPTNHRYIDHPREMTLPGEFERPDDTPRAWIGNADDEHATHCSSTTIQPDTIADPGDELEATRRQRHAELVKRLRRAQERATADAESSTDQINGAGNASADGRRGAGEDGPNNSSAPGCAGMNRVGQDPSAPANPGGSPGDVLDRGLGPDAPPPF